MPRQVESDFTDEFAAAQKAGFETALFDFDALTRENNLHRALRFVPQDSAVLLYRGWMLKSADYARFTHFWPKAGRNSCSAVVCEAITWYV